MAVQAVVQTGDERADRVVQAVVATLTRLLPGQVRSCYLLGSHAESTSHAASDVDMAVVLDEGAQRDRVMRAVELCTTASPLQLDVMAVTANELIDLYPGYLPVLKATRRLVWGEDVVATMPWPDRQRYAEHSIDLALASMSAIRNGASVSRPLDYPDPTGEFFGYDSRIRGVTLVQRHRLRGLVGVVTRTAIAVVAVRSGRFCTSREEHLRLYRESAPADMADLVEQIVGRCRTDWQYDVPPSAGDRTELRDMCREMLAFERSALADFDGATRTRTS